MEKRVSTVGQDQRGTYTQAHAPTSVHPGAKQSDMDMIVMRTRRLGYLPAIPALQAIGRDGASLPR